MSDDGKPTLVDRPGGAARTSPAGPREKRYASGDEIARGGMGRVVEATDTLLGRTVAVKEALTLDPDLLRRFARETKITARLEHPSIVPVYDAGIDGDAPFYVMRRVTGQPLSDLIGKAPSLALRLALIPHVLAAAQAVAHAHQRKIVHRDIKPANILVGELGETVVIDWGLAKVLDEDDDDDPIAPVTAGDSLQTRAGIVFGTPGFMSAGQLKGEAIGKPADVYALGATLYSVLAGKPPHHAPTGDAMMALAAQGPPRPLAELAPGVPRELTTIVDTALAFGEARYLDAGAFAEDLRRFSTGQLVASHSYSSRERLWRFVRLHRAAVVIGTAALATIAVISVLAIQRVVAARDRADDEARQAEAAGLRERLRAEQMLILRAGTLVDTNPTQAVAVLKDLDPASPRVAEAHAIVSTAEMRGIAWGMEGPSVHSPILDLDPSATRLLQLGLDGELRLWNLETRALVWKLDLTRLVRAAWIGDRILLYGEELEPALLDPATGARTTLALPRVVALVASDDGSSVIAETIDHDVVRLDIANLRAAPVWPDHHIKTYAQSGDGNWTVVTDGKEVVILDRSDRVIATRTGDIRQITASHTNRIAVVDGTDLFEVTCGANPRWRPIDYRRYSPVLASIRYRGDRMLVGVGTGQVLVDVGTTLIEAAHPKAGLQFPADINGDDLIGMTGDRTLLYFDAMGMRQIGLPDGLAYPRLAARRGRRRAVVAGLGAILVFDLDRFAPIRMPLAPEVWPVMIDDALGLMASDDRAPIAWRNFETGERTPIAGNPRWILESFDVDPATGRIATRTFLEKRWAIQLYNKNRPEVSTLGVTGDITPPQLVDGGVLYGDGTEVRLVGSGTGKPRTLATLHAKVAVVIRRGPSGWLAMTNTGEMVRGELAGGPTESVMVSPYLMRMGRVEVLEPTIGGVLATDHLDRPIVVSGNRLLRWTDRLETIADLGDGILGIAAAGRRAIVKTDKAAAIVDLETGKVFAVPHHEPSAVHSADGSLLAFPIDGAFRLMDTATGTTSISTIPRGTHNPVISPHALRMFSRFNDDLLVWTLPVRGDDLRARLDRLTNATVSADGALRWPWQPAP